MDTRTTSADAWLFEPALTYRVDNDVFLGTPLPPEEPQAKNPPDGAVIDYYLRSAVTDLKLELLDGNGKVLRRYTSREKPRKHMDLPIAERWFPEPLRLESNGGMHRFVWDLRYASSGDSDEEDASDETTAPKGPRVPPGAYQARLTQSGQVLTQKFEVKMDPRSAATPEELTQQYRTGTEIYTTTMLSRKALAEIKSVQNQLEAASKEAAGKPELLKQITDMQTSIKNILVGDKQALGLASANGGIGASLRVAEGGDRAVPAQAMELYRQCDAALQVRAEEWQRLKSGGLMRLNRELEKGGVAPVKMAEIEEEVQYLMTR